MDLFPFQQRAAESIADRYEAYAADPLMIDRQRAVPFIQVLSAITGAGKTAILATALQELRARLPVEPLVLWLSRGRVVVSQAYHGFTVGRYKGLLQGFTIKPLLEGTTSEIAANEPLLLVATAAKIATSDKDAGDRLVHRTSLDSGADDPLWEILGQRLVPTDAGEVRRPLIVVYDEGHNLSDLQTRLLDELAPDGLVLASATSRVPRELDRFIGRLRADRQWTDADFVTAVSSKDAVDSGLIKSQVLLAGYIAPMATTLDDLLEDMQEAEKAAKQCDADFEPKAIYVTTTNTVDGSSPQEDRLLDFDKRQARPIVIWRHLVDKGVDPRHIVVYCALKFDKRFQAPPEFTLLAGGDSDYDRLRTGEYKHIIFNRALQEGWDDPSCGFAYIDKDMGSPVQVAQVVGRVLRQPGAEHYPNELLNTAHFYVRTDEKGVFESVVQDVKSQIAMTPEVQLRVRLVGQQSRARAYEHPKDVRDVPTAAVESDEALEPIRRIVANIHDYRGSAVNTQGEGGKMQVFQKVGDDGSNGGRWVATDASNRVTTRWILRREVRRLFASHHDRTRDPVNLCDIEQEKFDALVELTSPAANAIRNAAREIVDAYIAHSTIIQNCADHPFRVGPVAVGEDAVAFQQSLHGRYSDLNELELSFARALDSTGSPWCRNPVQGGYSVPLLDLGPTMNFFPDFLAWVEDRLVFAIDTKAEHLIQADGSRKLFFIEPVEPGAVLHIRLVTPGRWEAKGQPEQVSTDGFTVWMQKNGRRHPVHCPDIVEAARQCLVAPASRRR